MKQIKVVLIVFQRLEKCLRGYEYLAERIFRTIW